MNATATKTHTGNVVGRCTACRTVIVKATDWNIVNTTCTCGKRVRLVAIFGRETERQCGVKCTSALGPTCDCTCGGKNHAMDHRS